MYYIGFFANDLNKMMKFFSGEKPTKRKYPYFGKVLGPYRTLNDVEVTIETLKRGYGYTENPAVSERQRRFMCADLGRLRSGKRTVTRMKESQLRDFCRKNPAISMSQIRRGTKHELEHTTDRAIARKIAMDHLREDPYYYTHLAKMEKQYKKNAMSPEKALRLTRKVIAHAKDIYREYKENPGKEYHFSKFMHYLKELEKYKVGSVPYISTLAKAHEHLASVKDSEHVKR